jgi:predicted nucleic acid-binding Zn ribbon protein
MRKRKSGIEMLSFTVILIIAVLVVVTALHNTFINQ